MVPPIADGALLPEFDAVLAASLVDGSDIAIIGLTSDGLIETWSHGAELLYGYSAASARGRPITILDPPDAATNREHFETALSGNTVRFETQHAPRYGSCVDVSVTIFPVRRDADSIIGVAYLVLDVSERKRAAQSSARLAAIVESSDDAIISKTLEGRITTWNKAAERIYGYSAAETIGSQISMLLAPGREDELTKLLASVAAGKRVSHLETVRRRKDGTLIDVSVTVSPILDASGRVIGASTNARDVTEQRRAERERLELVEASARAESANRAKSEFLARMSHELRSPLNTIIGFGQLLELEELGPRERDHVGLILKAARHLLEDINAVLDVANIEAGQITISPEPVALADTIRYVFALVAPLARERDVRLELNTAGLAGDGQVDADRNRLNQVVLNLLSNAIKYNRAGGRVDVSFALTSTGRVRTSIADTGIGIAPDQLARLFEPFERLGAELTEIEGTGLGLTLSRGLIEAMGGTIEVSSQPRAGTTFVVELGAAGWPRAEHQQMPHERELPELGSPVGLRSRIIYIEDNVSNLTLVERILDRHPGVELMPAMQATIGLELAREHRPDLVVLDLHLPDMRGTEALKRLKAEHPDVPVIVLTADAREGQEARVRQLGAADYLTKPLDVHQFVAVLAAHLNAHQGDEP